MDSLTQIILGAAVGEVAVGKKIGNRAMVWGAVAGTIPDFDVMIGNLFMNDINGLAFHRAITHSIFFAIGFSFLMAYYTNWLYSRGYHKNRWYKILVTIFSVGFTILTSAVLVFITKTLGGSIGLIIGGILAILAIFYFGNRMIKGYLNVEQESINIGYWTWYKLFFWSIFTHPILDCFTTYGTQLFAPFSNYRVAFNNISVADPAYTLPFLTFLIIASFMARSYDTESNNTITKDFNIHPKTYKTRRIINISGIVLSCLYMGWTFFNKSKVNTILEKTLHEKNIEYTRYMTSPTILNNILWSGTVETENSFYTGLYSFFDKKKQFELIEVPKNHHFLVDASEDEVVNTLRWFTNNYYSVIRRKDGRLQINDMRFGTFRGETQDEDSYIFRFIIVKDSKGNYDLKKATGGPERGKEKTIFGDLGTRIKGI